MAYKNQIKCLECGISIPPVPEDATTEEMLCDICYEETENAKTDENVPEWAIGIEPEIVRRAIKDHLSYKGLEMTTDFINLTPDGWVDLEKPIRVTVKELSGMKNLSDLGDETFYIESDWSVEIHPEDIKQLDLILPVDQLDPYIRGIIYCLKEGVLVNHYKGF